MNLDTIIFIGDSLTFGYGISKKDSFVFKVSEALPDKKILNKGVNGDTSSGILSRYYRDVISHNPKTTFIMCGTNDLLSGRDVNYIIGNLELMIKDLIEINSKIIIGIPPIILKDLAENLFSPSSYYDYTVKNLPILKDKINDLKEKYPLDIVDFYTLSKSNLSKGIFLDGIHLNALGNTLMFNEIIKLF
ncbi:hypothetical protein HMPREF1092_02226 [Clostridium thermobutyricum]|uniref:SGNH hydrolase-type esterase domain-containing protein n=1 Tax=Clostridium thermobutyricum TaxID=29372 RepID=N9XZN6_9CLOT|nr:GDSL-type esterase/lipase family protein [Clostridium thermobutyricum]ENZ01057.1 hypothetical protein HMPREF1092_02226 [Clostridium thermobutyricum]